MLNTKTTANEIAQIQCHIQPHSTSPSSENVCKSAASLAAAAGLVRLVMRAARMPVGSIACVLVRVSSVRLFVFDRKTTRGTNTAAAITGSILTFVMSAGPTGWRGTIRFLIGTWTGWPRRSGGRGCAEHVKERKVTGSVGSGARRGGWGFWLSWCRCR
jgi:hypothetical protein